MGKYFGTDGFRGEANASLKPEHAYKIGRFLGWYFRKGGKSPEVVTGTDTRLSSRMLESALAAGLSASGAGVYLMHIATTPNVSFAARTFDFDCGIMITASHNKFTDNGIKILDSNGRKISAEVEDLIEKFIDGDPKDLPRAKGSEIGRIKEYAEGEAKYKDYLISLAGGCEPAPFKGYKIGLDLSNGASYIVAREVFSLLGAEVYAAGDKPNGININEGVGSTHPEALAALVKENKLDLGFAFDGDADRCVAADENGEIIDGDGILYVCAKYLKSLGELNKNMIVSTVMSNMGLRRALNAEGIGCVQTDVGDKYVCASMVEGGYDLGGEQSGHIIFGKYSVTGDGILTAIMIMKAAIEKNKKLSELKSGFKIYPQYLRNIEVKDKEAVFKSEEVKRVRDLAESELKGRGRLLIRASGTEPLIRVMAEAETPELCKKYVDLASGAITSLN